MIFDIEYEIMIFRANYATIFIDYVYKLHVIPLCN